MKSAVLVSVGFLVAVPVGCAGRADDPEVTDDEGDVTWDGDALAPSPFQETSAVDGIAAWFHDETNASLLLTMTVVDLSRAEEMGANGGYARWGTRFQVSSYVPDRNESSWDSTWIAAVHFNNGPAGWRASLEPPYRDGERIDGIDIDHELDVPGNRMTVTIPKAALGWPAAGERLHGTLFLHDGDVLDVVRMHHTDQSGGANYGPGRDYVFQVPTPAESASADSAPEDPEPQGAIETNVTEQSDMGKSAPQVGALVVWLALCAAVWTRRSQSSK